MTINYFETVKATLDQTMDGCCDCGRVSRSYAIDETKRYVREISKAYYGDGDELRYCDPLCRMAYMFSYVAAHASFVDYAFREFDDLNKLLKSCMQTDWTLNVCSLGGGPGSELLGLTKYAERVANGNCLEVEYTIVDRVKEWDESWNSLKNNIERRFVEKYGRSRSNWPVRMSHSFLPLCLGDPGSLQNFLTRFANEDVFVLNFVVSEMRANPDPLCEFIKLLSERTNDAAYFLFIDRQEPGMQETVETVIEGAGLVVIDEMEQDRVIDYDEEKTDLGRWRSDLERDPLLKLKAFYKLATINPSAS